MTSDADSPEAALSVARELISCGIPVFVARPGNTSTGFHLPSDWQRTLPDPALLDTWYPGCALGAVMGNGLDLIDIDPRDGGSIEVLQEALSGELPRIYGGALTPSGGMHLFIASLGVRSLDKTLPGIDVKAGAGNGKGRGFAFIAPTVRTSKVTGEPTPYTWAAGPDFALLNLHLGSDQSGARLAGLVNAKHAGRGISAETGVVSPEAFMKVGPWRDVATTLSRGRNTGVFELAAALRGRGGFRLDDALAFMDAVVWPLTQQGGDHDYTREEYEASITGVWERYPDGAVARIEEAADTSSEQVPLAGVGLTDAYLADRVATQCLAGRFLWARGMGWMSWDGKRWSAVDASGVSNAVREFFIYLHSSAASGGADADALKRLAGLLSKARIGAVADLARGVPAVQVRLGEFDACPDLLNTGNGVVDLRTGELAPHDPALLMTKLCPVDYDPAAEHPDWKAALQAVPSEALGWYQIRLGQGITGHMPPDDVLVVQQGGGENGKSTLMSGVRAVLGDYYLLVSHRALLANADAHPTELMDFRGARLALLEETPEERRLSVTRLKTLVGTPEITARRIRQDSVTFAASHSLFLSTNYLPQVAEVDHGTWRRLACLKFPYRWLKPGQEAKGERDRTGDPDLRARLARGDSGQHEAVLAWLVTGALAWYQAEKVMPAMPDRVEEDTLEWRGHSDHVLAFCRDQLDFDPTRYVLATDLLDAFNQWMVSRGHKAWSNELFNTRFGGHQIAEQNNVEYRRARPETVTQVRSHRPGVSRSVTPGRPWVWFCVKFRDEVGDGESPSPVPDQGAGKSDTETKPQVAQNLDQGGPTLSIKQGIENAPRGLWIGLVHPGPESQGVAESETLRIATESLVKPSKRGGYPTLSKRDLEKEHQRHLAVERASGPVRRLPALVLRDGSIHPISATDAGEYLCSLDELTVDVETSGYPIGHREYRLRTVQLGDADASVVFDPEDVHQAGVISSALESAPVLHAHSATADLVPLGHAGLLTDGAAEAWSRMWDTVIPAKLLDPQSTGSDPGLKQLSESVLGDEAVSTRAEADRAALFGAGRWLKEVKATTPHARNGWAQVDSRCETMIRYAAADVLDTAALADRLRGVDPAVMDRERRVQAITAVVTHRGLRLDGEHVEAKHAEHTMAREIAGDEIRERFGIDNPGSPAQVGKKLAELGAELPKTDGGALSTKTAALEPLEHAQGELGVLVRSVLAYRHHSTALSLLLDPYLELVRNGDGRARPTVYTLQADTGRMSCVRPNLQQVSREGGLRACVTADPGHLLVSADFAGVELRVAAALSQDEAMMRFIEEEDAGRSDGLHWAIAREVWGPEATKSDRYRVKRGVFGTFYGIGVAKLAATLGIPQWQAASIRDVLADMAPGYWAWSRRLMDTIKRGQRTFESYSGRVIHLDIESAYKGPNYLIQGTARELCVDALLKWDGTEFGGGIVLPVHDEVVAMVPGDRAADATAALLKCMEMELLGVRIKAEASEPSYAWADSV
jgi:P4 family phage/plasmid primase-like protien